VRYLHRDLAANFVNGVSDSLETGHQAIIIHTQLPCASLPERMNVSVTRDNEADFPAGKESVVIHELARHFAVWRRHPVVCGGTNETIPQFDRPDPRRGEKYTHGKLQTYTGLKDLNLFERPQIETCFRFQNCEPRLNTACNPADARLRLVA
jgi:hypothetical protein